MHDEQAHVDLSAVQAWSAESQVPATHARLMQLLRASLKEGGDRSLALSALEMRREMVEATLVELEASRDACDLLAADLLEAIARGLSSMRAYVGALEDALTSGGAVDDDWLQSLDGLQEAMVAAHHGLAAASVPDTVEIPLAVEVAGVPSLRALHRVLQACLNGRASLDQGRAAVADLAARFDEARAQWTAPPPEAADAAAVAEILLVAYESGTEALARLEAGLPTLDVDALAPPWQMLEEAFARMYEAQALRAELEDDLGLDFLSDE